MRQTIQVFWAMVLVTTATFGISSVMEWNPLITFFGVLSSTFVPSGAAGALFAGLNKEIWTKQIKEGFYPDTSFLKYFTDMSGLVEYDKINLAEAGLDPTVLLDNTSYPIAVADRDDTPISIELHLLETENSRVRHPDAVELSYDKLESVIMGHRNSLKAFSGTMAAHATAPTQDSANTPIVETTGADDGDGLKQLTIKDILTLKKRFDVNDVPLEDRYLVLHPNHVEQLILIDTQVFKELGNYKDGKLSKFAGFSLLEFTKNPLYNRTNMQKVAFGAVATPATDTYCSWAFQSKEVMKADGSLNVYADEKTATERATLIGFDKRFVALPFRGKGIGAIVGAAV